MLKSAGSLKLQCAEVSNGQHLSKLENVHCTSSLMQSGKLNWKSQPPPTATTEIYVNVKENRSFSQKIAKSQDVRKPLFSPYRNFMNWSMR